MSPTSPPISRTCGTSADIPNSKTVEGLAFYLSCVQYGKSNAGEHELQPSGTIKFCVRERGGGTPSVECLEIRDKATTPPELSLRMPLVTTCAKYEIVEP